MLSLDGSFFVWGSYRNPVTLGFSASPSFPFPLVVSSCEMNLACSENGAHLEKNLCLVCHSVASMRVSRRIRKFGRTCGGCLPEGGGTDGDSL